MSHIVRVETRIRDVLAVRAACRRLGLAEPVQGTAKLFSGEASGLLVKLPAWQYPVVVDTTSGEVRYDNYEGRWGEQKCLDALLQAYAVEKTKIEARRKATSARNSSSRMVPSS